ncbi:hypothetical protein AX17_000472 [Amanita inopinata Kibby_2008]|nr:hypothetical protein AX17_000472 [Amanita inopinata Kibby_2008]
MKPLFPSLFAAASGRANHPANFIRTGLPTGRCHLHTTGSSALYGSDSFSESQTSREIRESASFEDLGLHPPIVAALRKAFPNVKAPTSMQADFIPAILDGNDLLLRDTTGSGKSFGLLVALLNKPRLRTRVKRGGRLQEFHHITSLVVVPHRDLAYQFLHWIQRIAACSAVEQAVPLTSIVQILVRDGGAHLTTGLTSLRETSPHILIGTPQALMDVWRKDQEALQLSRLSTVVVDEVDYLVETLPKKDPKRSFLPAVMKAAKKILAHPGITRELLDIIYMKRKQLGEQRQDEPGLTKHMRRIGREQDGLATSSLPLPQLVLCSATLRGHLRSYLFEESGWLNKDNLVVFKGTQLCATRTSVPQAIGAACNNRENDKINMIGGSRVTHSVLVVSDDVITNIDGALPADRGESENGHESAVAPETIFGAAAVSEIVNVDKSLVDKYANTPSPFNPNALEAVATAFALDVPSIALLVLPSSAPVQRAIYELREMGVNAHGLEKHLLSGVSGIEETPILLVTTFANTRGLDLPELEHVFILGIPEGPKVTARSVDAYLHIAGRVGRFGRGGKVITVVEKGVAAGEGTGGMGDAAKMARILRTIEVGPVRFEYFD